MKTIKDVYKLISSNFIYRTPQRNMTIIFKLGIINFCYCGYIWLFFFQIQTWIFNAVNDRKWSVNGRKWSVSARQWSVSGRMWSVSGLKWSDNGRKCSVIDRKLSVSDWKWSVIDQKWSVRGWKYIILLEHTASCCDLWNCAVWRQLLMSSYMLYLVDLAWWRCAKFQIYNHGKFWTVHSTF